MNIEYRSAGGVVHIRDPLRSGKTAYCGIDLFGRYPHDGPATCSGCKATLVQHREILRQARWGVKTPAACPQCGYRHLPDGMCV